MFKDGSELGGVFWVVLVFCCEMDVGLVGVGELGSLD